MIIFFEALEGVELYLVAHLFSQEFPVFIYMCLCMGMFACSYMFIKCTSFSGEFHDILCKRQAIPTNLYATLT